MEDEISYLDRVSHPTCKRGGKRSYVALCHFIRARKRSFVAEVSIGTPPLRVSNLSRAVASASVSRFET